MPAAQFHAQVVRQRLHKRQISSTLSTSMSRLVNIGFAAVHDVRSRSSDIARTGDKSRIVDPPSNGRTCSLSQHVAML